MSHDTDGIRLTPHAAEHPAVFAAAFNSGDPAVLEQVYEPNAVFVKPDGTRVVGEDRRAANTEFQGLGVGIEVRVRNVHEYEDLALLIVDWAIRGTTAQGSAIDLCGTATDVARRGTDGLWRYIIDSPLGIDTAGPEHSPAT
ncbi:YybH family protein [Halostreptopolyspora alba]|uniref:Nuclear transport factor 2 family protein n=1 Tax=Halostreptopolyspora alba TaxID=2487137 RepID=A0A3N0E4B8_9ACTN|nr:nuclear transport factor 2 family protein [Nocardiopsaceae bacterium YIM 96095]